MFFATYRSLLKLPNFRGKARLAAYIRKLLAPKTERVYQGVRMELDPQERAQIDLLRIRYRSKASITRGRDCAHRSVDWIRFSQPLRIGVA